MDMTDILFLIADDMHHGNDMDLYTGPAGASMPELRKLKNEGQLMAEMPHGSVVCSPSRAATQTGCNPAKDGMYSTAGSALNTFSGIPDGRPTLFSRLMTELGYRCALFGKNHMDETFPGVHRYGWAHPDGPYVPASAAADLAAPVDGTDPIMRDTIIGDECAAWIDDAVAAEEP
jgi:arylsulfatase A-like enzyme